MRVTLSTPLDAPPEWVAAHLQSTAVFRHITAPLVHFSPPAGTDWPRLWAPGNFEVRIRLLGWLPMGPQTVRISVEAPAEPGGWPTLRDNGEGRLMRRWDHRITLQPLPDGRTLYTDDIEVVARYLPLLMTPLSALFAHVFYRHRQRRWRALAQAHAATGAPPSPVHVRDAFERLLHAFAAHPQAPAAQRWRRLEAAHVLGQTVFSLHWRSHCAMLHYALQLRDTREADGQIVRLALVPLGHLLGRLPQGNIGRSHAPALQPMVPAPEVTALIEQALEDTALAPRQKPAG